MPSDGVGPWPWSQKATFQSIYCCVTNHLKTLWLKTAISSYFSQSCWSEMGGTRPCSSIDQEMSFGVIHLVAFFWQVSWAEKSKKVFAPLRVASPCGYLGLSHSMWAQVKLQFLHTLLVYNERGSSYQLLWRPGPETLRRLLFPNSVSQGKLKDGRNQIERKDSPRLDVRNICKYKEEKNLWEPNLETRYHKQWTENCGWKMPIEFRDILNKIHVLSVSL